MPIHVGHVIRPFNCNGVCHLKFYVTATSKSNGPLHFYQNKQLELYASRKAHPLTLRQLVNAIVLLYELLCNMLFQVFFGRSMNEERLIKVGV